MWNNSLKYVEQFEGIIRGNMWNNSLKYVEQFLKICGTIP